MGFVFSNFWADGREFNVGIRTTSNFKPHDSDNIFPEPEYNSKKTLMLA